MFWYDFGIVLVKVQRDAKGSNRITTFLLIYFLIIPDKLFVGFDEVLVVDDTLDPGLDLNMLQRPQITM